MSRLLFFAPVLVLVACGPRQPPAKPGEIMMWKVVSSDVKLASCSDDPEFRQQITPIQFEADRTYLIYRMEQDGKTATAMTCQTLNRSTCTESTAGIVYQVAGNELLFSRETKSPIGSSGCQLQSAQSWTLTDHGETLDMVVTNALSLVDNPTACADVEDQVKARSPNKVGLQGCVVTFSVGTALD